MANRRIFFADVNGSGGCYGANFGVYGKYRFRLLRLGQEGRVTAKRQDLTCRLGQHKFGRPTSYKSNDLIIGYAYDENEKKAELCPWNEWRALRA